MRIPTSPLKNSSSGGGWQDIIRQGGNRFDKVQGTGYSALFDSDDFDSDDE